MRKLLKDLLLDAQDFLQDGDTDLAIRTYQTALENAKKDDAEKFLALTYLAMAFDEADEQKKSTEYFAYHLTQKDLATKLGLHENQIQKYERKDYDCASLETFRELRAF